MAFRSLTSLISSVPRVTGERAFTLRALSTLLIAAFSVPLFSSAFLYGCAAEKASSKPAYLSSLERWTRSAKIYEGFEARLHISATFKDISFRRSYTDRYAESNSLSEEYRRALSEREAAAVEEYNEFFVSAYTPEERWNDFDRADSVWKLYLEDGSGAKLKPVSIKKVDVSDPLIREFFPYLDLWSKGYIVRFPKYSEAGEAPIPSGDTEYLRLSVTGVLGRGELVWRLKEPLD